MILKVRNFSIARSGIPVLEGLAFDLEPGKAIFLRGPNGVGKTTLLRTIAGLQPAIAGEISVEPEMLAYASHLDGTKSALTVVENLRFWAAIYQTGDITSAMASLDLLSLADRQVGNLSAGQRRRVGLARLIVTGRKIWLLDEPTVSLDATALGLLAQMITFHLDQGGSALIATHVPLGVFGNDLDLKAYRALRPMNSANRNGFDEAVG